MKYSENIYMKALAALAALRTTLPEKEQHTVDFVAASRTLVPQLCDALEAMTASAEKAEAENRWRRFTKSIMENWEE